MSRRTLQTGAFALILATGTALTSCSSDSDEAATTGSASESSATASDSSTAQESSGAPSSSESDTPSENPDASEASETDASERAGTDTNEPVDLNAALLGPDDAPAGFTFAQNEGGDTEMPEGTVEMLNAMDFEPAHCKDVLNQRLQGEATDTDARTTNYVRGEEASILVAVSPGTDTEPNDCANISANGKAQEIPFSITTTSKDVPVTVNGAEQVSGTSIDTTIGIGPQKTTATQTSVNGVVNGVSFTVMGGGDVDQATLVSVAEAQAQRLEG